MCIVEFSLYFFSLFFSPTRLETQAETYIKRRTLIENSLGIAKRGNRNFVVSQI